jgi:hypothetical protein
MKLIELIALIPELFKLIKAIEEALPEAGQGTQKLKLVREFMENLFENISDMWPKIERLVSIIVSFYNSTGVFKK